MPPMFRTILGFEGRIDSENFLVHYSSSEDNEFLFKASSQSPVKLTV